MESLYFAFMVLRPAFSNGRYYLISSIALSTVKILNMLLYYEPVFIKTMLLRVYSCTLYYAMINLVEKDIVQVQ